MTQTVVEVRGRGGQLIERFRSASPILRVGRAFDNDLILEDEYACPHHLRIVREADLWRVEDLGSVNGEKPGPGSELRSGDTLRVGQTTLHFYASEHPVPPARQLSTLGERVADLGRHPVWIGLALVTAFASVVDQLWNTAGEFEALPTLAQVPLEWVALGMIAAIWALVGRVVRHRAYFLSHLSVWLLYQLSDRAATFVAEVVAYNASASWIEVGLSQVSSVGLLALTLWASLSLATNLPGPRRTLAASLAAFAIIGTLYAQQLGWETHFSSTPDYYARLKAPWLRWSPATQEAELAEALAPLFDRADEAIEDD